LFFFVSLCRINLKQMANKDLNRLKVVLAEKKRTNKWLAEQLGKDQGTISKWCTNTSQPDMETLARISKLLGVGVEELYNRNFMESV
jgi:Helix-turn-helix.